MKALRVPAVISAALLAYAVMLFAQGPITGRRGETVARPKQPAAEQPRETDLEPIPSEFKRDPNAPQSVPTYSVDAIEVTLDVAVVDNQGHFIPNIPKEYFYVEEDKEPQQVRDYSMGEAPITIAMVIEFSNLFQQYYSEPWYQTRVAASTFLQTLRPDDFVAIVAYDLRPEILSDFSTDRRYAIDAMMRLNMPGFSEANLYDALVDTAQRMQDIEGRKAILLISSGVDTFSKLNFGEARKAIQNAGVPVYSVGLMQAIRDYYYQLGYINDIQRTDFLMADNQLRTFSKESGGLAFFPRFYGQFNEIFSTISQALRSQYVLTYSPTNQERDGKFRKIKVELRDPNTGDKLKITDPKKKNIKYEIVTKAGYQAPREVE